MAIRAVRRGHTAGKYRVSLSRRPQNSGGKGHGAEEPQNFNEKGRNSQFKGPKAERLDMLGGMGRKAMRLCGKDWERELRGQGQCAGRTLFGSRVHLGEC